MVSALVSRSSGPGSSPGWGQCVVFLGKTLLSPCFTQVCKWVILGVALRGTSISTRGGVEVLLVSLCCWKTEISPGLMGQLGRM